MTPLYRGGAKKRRDQNEPEIIGALQSAGVQVWQLSGAGLPDLLCFSHGRYIPLEVKTRTGKLTRVQAAASNPWPIVRSAEDALREVFGR